MAVGRDPLFFGQFEPLLFRVERSPVDANQLDDRLKKVDPNIAAVIIEPLVQGAGGMRMHSPNTLRQIADVCIRHNVLLIADEVMTAGRTGSWWAHTQAGISPDLICSAKTLAGGVFSLAATLVSPKVVAEFDVPEREKTFFHGHSFTGHPLACAVAVENFRMLDEGDWLRNVPDQAPMDSAAETLRDIPSVSNVRVQGTILACDVGAGGISPKSALTGGMRSNRACCFVRWAMCSMRCRRCGRAMHRSIGSSKRCRSPCSLFDHTDPRQRPIDHNGLAKHQAVGHKAPCTAVRRRGTVVAQTKVVAGLHKVRLHVARRMFAHRVVDVTPDLQLGHCHGAGVRRSWPVRRVEYGLVEVFAVRRGIIAGGAEIQWFAVDPDRQA